MTMWSIDSQGNAGINGQKVEARIYNLFDQLRRLSDPLVLKQADSLFMVLLAYPVTAPLVWEQVQYNAERLKPELLAQAALAHWEGKQSRAETILGELSKQKETVQQAMLRLLQEADDRRTPQRREAYRETLALWKRTRIQREQASQSAEDWFQYWAELLRQNRLDSYSSQLNLLPDIAPGQHSEVMHLMLNAQAEDFAPNEQATDYERSVFPGQWRNAISLAFAKALAGPLDPDTRRLTIRELVAQRGHLSFYGDYGIQLKEFVEQAHQDNLTYQLWRPYGVLSVR